MSNQDNTVKERLIICGITEIEEHGLTDFSLRRVASSCGVSCAAPYKHFKNKDDLILAILQYIAGQWALLENQIIDLFDGSPEKQIEEIAIAFIKFWIANPNFRSILLMNPKSMDDKQRAARADIDKSVRKLISDYCQENGLGDDKKFVLTYKIHSYIYGALLMLENGELQKDETTIRLIKESVKEGLKYEI